MANEGRCKVVCKLRSTNDTWKNTFGMAYPLINAVIGIIVFAIATYVLIWVGENQWMGVSEIRYDIIEEVGRFLQDHILLFFLLMVFTNYSDYAISRNKSIGRWVKPPVIALTVVVVAWIFVSALKLFTSEAGFVGDIISAIELLYIPLFLFALFIGYVVAFVDFAKGSDS